MTEHEILELIEDSDHNVFNDEEIFMQKGNVAYLSDSDSDMDVTKDLVLDNSSMSATVIT